MQLQQLSFEDHFDYPQDAIEAKKDASTAIALVDNIISQVDTHKPQPDGLTTHPLFPIPLRPYQIDGARFLRESQRAFCTYEPGLGKTETAISACVNIDKPCYIVTTHNVLCDDDGDYVEHTTVTGHWYPTPSTFDASTFEPLNLHHTVASSRRIMRALEQASLLPPRAKALITAPSFMMDEWYERILSYLPDARVVLASGQRKQRERVLNYNADWFIINYEMLHKRQRKLTKAQWEKLKHIPRDPYALPTCDYYIFDESQNLKNHQGKQAQAAAELVDPNNFDKLTVPSAPDQQHVYLLSGTPIKREPDDLYMQLHIMYPHMGTNRIYDNLYFNSYNDFVRNYCVWLPSPRGNVVVGAKGQSLQRKLGQSTPIQQLMDKVAHYISYEDAEVYRPEVQVTIKHFTLDDKFQEAYDEIAQMYAYKDLRMYSAMEVMHALRAVTACPTKISSAISLAEQFHEGCMFFTYYVGSAKLLASQLSNALNVEVPWIAGQPHTTYRQRDEILNTEPKYLVGTLKSLSVGTNKLRHMKAVVFFEEDWTPDVLEQATNRVRRFGNDATKVFVYYLLAKGTIDDQIHATVGRRGITAEAIVRRTLQKWKREHKNA